MAEEPEPRPAGRKRRLLLRVLLAALVLAVVAAAMLWFTRKEIAHDIIGDALREAGVEATYTVEQISPDQQVLRNVVIGDPAQPDFTASRVEIDTQLTLGLPELRQVRVIDPRLFGTFSDGSFSFGALDPLIFTDDEEPFALPDLDLAIIDGRGLIESDYGRFGVRLTGSGHLQDGFEGELALVSPALAFGSCQSGETSLFGRVNISDERPSFAGPVRFDRFECGGATIADGAVQLDTGASRDLAALSGNYSLRSGAVAAQGISAETLTGQGSFDWARGALALGYDLALGVVETPFAFATRLALDGRASSTGTLDRLDTRGEARAEGVRLANDVAGQLAEAERMSAGTLAAPILGKIRGSLTLELDNALLFARYGVVYANGATALALPQANLRGRSGATLLAVSQANIGFTGGALSQFAGNFITGGEGLPRIAGRASQAGSGPLALQVRMQEYAAGEARLALPSLALTRAPNGQIATDGQLIASGPIAGGFVRDLMLPLDGVIGANGALAMGRACTNARFSSLQLANFTLGKQDLRLCPTGGVPILRFSPAGLQVTASSGPINLSGSIGDTPFALASGPTVLSWPGTLTTGKVAMTLGQAGSATHFEVDQLVARMSPAGFEGNFEGGSVVLAPVPLNLDQASGNWRFAGGRLDLTDMTMAVADREEVDRFKPLTARNASLSLIDNRITAEAMLHEASRDLAVAEVRIGHDLNSAIGHADLIVEGITFTPRGFSPRDLSELAYGVVSLVDGTVRGNGRIDWSDGDVRSTGRFTANAMNFAAPFGPVRGASGTVEFTDLLGLTTAPDQRITLAAINPGIEVYDGEVGFQLTNGEVLRITGGTWPFLGGTLRMLPSTLNIGKAETRTYVLEIEGLEAERFIERMELSNLAASGVFDGSMPIIFDEMGNGRLQGGFLTARMPGGHLSYVGQLTYEDTGFFSNLAFSTLRDLRFSEAQILLDGPLTGELVTRVNFEGIGQGESATSNFLTRQIARLPIRLRLNIRAPFYQLISSTRALYDPASVRDPRSLGLITADGIRLRNAIDRRTVEAQDAAVAEAAAEAERNNQPSIQPPESEAMP